MTQNGKLMKDIIDDAGKPSTPKGPGNRTGLLGQTVTCSNCGWSWKAVDGGSDPMTCHRCGGMIKMEQGGEMIRRADGSYSRRGLWDNIRANSGSGKAPTKEMLEQERKIKNVMAMGGVPCYDCGGLTPEQSVYAYMAYGGLYYPMADDGMYMVQSGDTLSKIARKYNVSVKDLVAENNIANPDMINISQKLAIPGYKAPAAPAPVVSAPVGKAYADVQPMFNTEDDRKAYQQRLREIAREALGDESDEKYLLNTAYHNIDEGNNCINGVCGLDLKAGLKFSNPTGVDRYLSNPSFAKAVAEKKEDYYQINKSPQIGDHMVYLQKFKTYKDPVTGKEYEQRNVPYHSKKIFDITTDADGTKKYHVIHNAGGKSFRENIYSEEEMNAMIKDNEVNMYRPGYSLDKDKLAKERINMSPEAYQAYTERESMKSMEKTMDPGYQYSVRQDSEYAKNTPEGMLKFIQYANNDKNINQLVEKLGVPKSVIHDELLNTFGELGQENKWENRTLAGSGFGTEGVVEKMLASVNGGKGWSVGPGQIKFNAIPKDLRKMFDINRTKDLYDWDKVIPLMTAMNIRNRQWLDRKGDKAGEYILGQEGVTSDQLPYDKGRYTPSMYRGLRPNIIKKLQKEAEASIEGFRIPSEEKAQIIQKYIDDHLAENQLQLGEGSYANAVFNKIDKNLQRVRTNVDPRGDLLPEVTVVGRRKKANGGPINNTPMNSIYDFMARGGEPNGEMALGQMSAVADKMSKLRQFISTQDNLDPWIASKLAVMDHSADAISDYLMYGPDAQEQDMPEMGKGGYTVTRSSARKGKTHKVTGPDGTVKYFGDSKLGQHPDDPARKKAFYARHKKNLQNNPYFRAFARATWADGGEVYDMPEMKGGGSTFSGNAWYGYGGYMPEAMYGWGMAEGGGIHLDPAKKGTFKAQATRMGMGVQEAAAHILANKEEYSPAMVKKANFARNFAKAEGGPTDPKPRWHAEWDQDPLAGYTQIDPSDDEIVAAQDAANVAASPMAMPQMNVPVAKAPVARKANPGASIVDFLNSQGAKSDFATRKAVAEKVYGFKNYTGTAEQNQMLLEIMSGKKKPGASNSPSQTSQESDRPFWEDSRAQNTYSKSIKPKQAELRPGSAPSNRAVPGKYDDSYFLKNVGPLNTDYSNQAMFSDGVIDFFTKQVPLTLAAGAAPFVRWGTKYLPYGLKEIPQVVQRSRAASRALPYATRALPYGNGGFVEGQEIEITDPEQLRMLQEGGYTYEII